MKLSPINLEDYFEFLSRDDIRIKGTRVGIETVLDDYLNASSPEEIAIRYPTLNLEQIYATITYYLRNKREIDNYLKKWRTYCENSWKEQLTHPTPAISRLNALKKQRASQSA